MALESDRLQWAHRCRQRGRLSKPRGLREDHLAPSLLLPIGENPMAKEVTSKTRVWKLLESIGIEVDDAERRVPIPAAQKRHVTRDLFGIADLACLPDPHAPCKGTLYVQVAYDKSDHEDHIRALLVEPAKFRRLFRVLQSGNHFLVMSYGRDVRQTLRITQIFNMEGGPQTINCELQDVINNFGNQGLAQPTNDDG